MLNTSKLLYILPDLAYFVELLPAKKPHSFLIQNFKQYNGQLFRDGKLIEENVERLIRKLDADQYSLILPDDFFTNTIINVDRSSEKAVKEYLKEEVIPSLHISSETHQIETFILSEYKGVFKVQLSTLQNSQLVPLQKALQKHQVFIDQIYPLSWVIKSLISLEPSISIIQLGEMLYMAKHYIGVDQPLADNVENIDRFVEAIKTLKGVESSLQTAYLVTEPQVEDTIKEKLAGILPVQQLADESGDNEQIAPHLEKIIGASMRTISIPDLETPRFSLKGVKLSAAQTDGTLTDLDSAEKEAEVIESLDQNSQLNDLDSPDNIDSSDSSAVISGAALPKPNSPFSLMADSSSVEDSLSDDSSLLTESSDAKDEKINLMAKDKDLIEELDEIQGKEINEGEIDEEEMKDEFRDESQQESHKKTQNNQDEAQAPNDKAETAVEIDEDIDLQRFATSAVITQPPTSQTNYSFESRPKMIVKNNDGTGNFLKLLLIGLGSFALTVAIGVGLGFGLLSLSKPTTPPAEEPVAEIVENVSPTPEPSPTPEVVVDREEIKLRVVNATTKAGYAGQVASQLKTKKYAQVDAKNAVEDYEPGVYLLMATEDQALLQALADDLEIELAFAEGVKAEDPKGEYDAVIVLAQ